MSGEGGLLRRPDAELQVEAALREGSAVRVVGWAGVGKSVLLSLLGADAPESRLETEPREIRGLRDVVVAPFQAEETESWLLLETGAVAEGETLAEIHRLAGGVAGAVRAWTERLRETGALRVDRDRLRLVAPAPEEVPESVRRLLAPRIENFPVAAEEIAGWISGARAPREDLLARAIRRGLVRRMEEGLAWGHPLLSKILGCDLPARAPRRGRRLRGEGPVAPVDVWRDEIDALRDLLDRGANDEALARVKEKRERLRREAMPILAVPFLTLGASAAGRRGSWDDAWSLLEEAEAVAGAFAEGGAADADHLGWRTAGTRAWLYARSNRIDEAEAYGREILVRAVGEDLAVERSIAHTVLAEAKEKRGDFEEAARGWGRALAEARETGLAGVAPRLLYRLARAREQSGDAEAAARIFAASWEEAARDGKDFTSGLAALGGARVAIAARRAAEALRWAERALIATRAGGNARGEEIAKHRIEEARRLAAREALPHSTPPSSPSPHSLSSAAAPPTSAPSGTSARAPTASRGDLFPRGRRGAAKPATWGDVESYRDALAQTRDAGARREIARRIDFALRDVAEARWREGDLDGCEKALRERWRTVSAPDHPTPGSRDWTRKGLAKVLLERARYGAPQERRKAVDEAILHLDRAGDAKGLAFAYRLRAELAPTSDGAARDHATSRTLRSR